MTKKPKLCLALFASGLILLNSCGPSARQQELITPETGAPVNPLLYGFNESVQFGSIREGDITEATDEALAEAQSILEDIKSTSGGGRTFDNTMLKIDDIRNVVEKVWSPAYLMGSTHPSEAIRAEGDTSSIRFERFLNELAVNEDLYNAVMAYSATDEAKSLTGYRKRFLDETIRDFRRSGFGLSKEKREKVKEIQNLLADTGLEFRRNISSYQDTLFITMEEAAGLPESYLKERLQSDSTYAIDMSYPSYFPFMKFAKSDSARKKLSYAFLNRAEDDNLDVLDQMLRLRRELVETLGYSTYAAYRTEDRMAKDPATVWKFERDLKNSLEEKARLDYAQLLGMKSGLTGEPAAVVYPWEKWYYENQLLLTKYRVDEQEVKQYFEVGQVIEGLFAITQRLFNLEYREVQDPSVWHEDARMFEVYDRGAGGRMIGRFYLDLFPRPNKFRHAAAFSIVMGKRFPEG
ncbi:MAG: M3 family metallopeptidase, partial [Fidelibacterota bacterium]